MNGEQRGEQHSVSQGRKARGEPGRLSARAVGTFLDHVSCPLLELAICPENEPISKRSPQPLYQNPKPPLNRFSSPWEPFHPRESLASITPHVAGTSLAEACAHLHTPTQVFLPHRRETMLDSVGLLVTTEFPGPHSLSLSLSLRRSRCYLCPAQHQSPRFPG